MDSRTAGRTFGHLPGVAGMVGIGILVAACASGSGTILSQVGGAMPQSTSGTAGSVVPADRGGSAGSGSGSSGSGAANATPAPGGQGSGGSPTDGPGGGGGGMAPAAPIEQLIIYNGTLSLQVPDIDAALVVARGRVAALGGYMAGSEIAARSDVGIATMTFRIPSARWSDAVEAIRSIEGAEIREERTESQDVTGQVRDLGAQITNLKATERAVQAIMERATAIEDVLTVQRQLTEIRGQIERLSTEQAHLQDQAGFGTLSVTFSLPPRPQSTPTPEPSPTPTPTPAWDPGEDVEMAAGILGDVGRSLGSAGIWLIVLWLPVLALLFVVGTVIVIVVRRLRTLLPPGYGSDLQL